MGPEKAIAMAAKVGRQQLPELLPGKSSRQRSGSNSKGVADQRGCSIS